MAARVALVSTGGSARGAFSAGVAHSLVVEHGLDPVVVAGVSIGAVNSAWLATAPVGDQAALRSAAEGLVRWWRESVPRPAWRMLTRGQRVAAVRQGLDHLDRAAAARSGRVWLGGATDARTGRWVCATSDLLEDPAVLEGIVAFPGVLPPVPVQGSLWMDGVVRRVVPIAEVLAQDVDEIVVITGGSPEIGAWKGGSGALRAIGIAAHELFFLKDVRTALEQRDLPVTVYAPTRPLTSPWRFDRRAIEASLEHGLEVGQSLQACDPAAFVVR